MKTWLITGIVLIVAGFVVGFAGGILHMTAAFSQAASGSPPTPEKMAEGISDVVLWTMGGMATSGIGLFLTVVAGVMYLFAKSADKK